MRRCTRELRCLNSEGRRVRVELQSVRFLVTFVDSCAVSLLNCFAYRLTLY